MDSEDAHGSPFRRPGFLWAAAVIAAILVLGAVVAAVQLNKPDSDPRAVPAPATTATAQSSSPTTEPPAPSSANSVCGLKGNQMTGTLSKAPATQWKYLGSSAYPSSVAYGPGQTSGDGYLYCFQQSPEGAVFAAANAAVQGSQPNDDPWVKYFIAAGAGREKAVAEARTAPEPSGDRVQIQGFRLLAYSGTSASVDVAFRVTPAGQSVLGSVVYALQWEDGDWKLVVDDDGHPEGQFQVIPDLSGYVSWRE